MTENKVIIKFEVILFIIQVITPNLISDKDAVDWFSLVIKYGERWFCREESLKRKSAGNPLAVQL